MDFIIVFISGYYNFCEGYCDKNISHQFEILGIMENLVDLQKESVKVLAKKQI